jgi:peptidoglycan/LPS O-acetylase OafA/YrhL
VITLTFVGLICSTVRHEEIGEDPRAENPTREVRLMKQGEKSSSYITGIDGLRAVAVVSVMLFHLDPGLLPGGFVGVDVFFVISGFVVTQSIYDKKFAGFLSLVSYFYVKRLIRIAPALIVMLVIASFFSNMLIPSAWLSDTNRNTALNAFIGFSNISLYRLGEDYFGPRIDFNPFVHTWSLGVEEQFYFTFPFILSISAIWKTISRVNVALMLTIAISFVSFLVCAYLSSRNPSFSFFQMPTRFWELGIGMTLALSRSSWQRSRVLRSSMGTKIASLGGFFGLLLSLEFCRDTAFPFPWAILPTLSSALLICTFAANEESLAATFMSSHLPSWLGRSSYSIYLWHWPVYVLMRWTTGLVSIPEKVSAVAIVLAISTLSYVFVEQPFRQSKFLGRLPRPFAIAALLLAVGLSAFLTRTLFNHQHDISLSVTRDVDVWSPYVIPRFSHGCSVVVTAQATDVASVSSMVPSNCGGLSRKRLFVAGDSHAGAYTELLAELAGNDLYEVYLYSSVGCPFLDLSTPTSKLSQRCATFYKITASEIIRQARPNDIVFLPSLRIPRYADQWGGQANRVELKEESEFSAASQDAVLFASQLANGVRIVLEAPKPLFKSPPFRCSDWFNAKNPICKEGFVVARSEIEARRAGVISIERALANSSQSMSVWDPLMNLCGPSVCDAFDNGAPLFFDGDHLSALGDRALYGSLRDHLRTLDTKAP